MEMYMLLVRAATARRDGMLALSALPNAPVLAEDPTHPRTVLRTAARRVVRRHPDPPDARSEYDDVPTGSFTGAVGAMRRARWRARAPRST